METLSALWTFFILLILCLLFTGTLAEDTDDPCQFENECASRKSARPFCIAVNALGDRRCRDCSSNCDCKPGYYCANDYNAFAVKVMGTCLPIHDSSSPIGKPCVPLNLNEVKKGVNDEVFCGKVSHFDSTTLFAKEAAWIGACKQSTCVMCVSNGLPTAQICAGSNPQTCVNDEWVSVNNVMIEGTARTLANNITAQLATLIFIFFLFFLIAWIIRFVISEVRNYKKQKAKKQRNHFSLAQPPSSRNSGAYQAEDEETVGSLVRNVRRPRSPAALSPSSSYQDVIV